VVGEFEGGDGGPVLGDLLGYQLVGARESPGAVGDIEGANEGFVGVPVGYLEGLNVGLSEGALLRRDGDEVGLQVVLVVVGPTVGALVTSVGFIEGDLVGLVGFGVAGGLFGVNVGAFVGAFVEPVGDVVGDHVENKRVGATVGFRVALVGLSVGDSVGLLVTTGFR
jgi:hypothetical protein